MGKRENTTRAKSRPCKHGLDAAFGLIKTKLNEIKNQQHTSWPGSQETDMTVPGIGESKNGVRSS
jgi:hypothetical protein